MRRLRYPFIAAIVLGLALVPSALALKVKKDPPPPPGYLGVAYVHDFEPDGGITPYQFRIIAGGLPPGLNISTDSGTVTGTPTQVGAFDFYVEVQSGSGAVSQVPFTITITVKFAIDSSPLPEAAINQPYSHQLKVTGGTATSWTKVSGELPAGLTLSSTGLIAGTPTAAGDFPFRVQANGASPLTDSTNVTLHVSAPLVLGGPTIAEPKEPVSLNWKIGQIVNWAVKANGGKQPYVYTSTTLPTGVTLNPDGNLVGEATVAGTTPVTFTVTDGTGATDTLRVVITFKALLAFSPAAKPKAGKVGKSYSWKLPVTGASKTKLFLASGTYPPGLSLDETTGILSGTPLKAGSYKVKFWVLGDPGTQVSKLYTIKIAA